MSDKQTDRLTSVKTEVSLRKELVHESALYIFLDIVLNDRSLRTVKLTSPKTLLLTDLLTGWPTQFHHFFHLFEFRLPLKVC